MPSHLSEDTMPKYTVHLTFIGTVAVTREVSADSEDQALDYALTHDKYVETKCEAEELTQLVCHHVECDGPAYTHDCATCRFIGTIPTRTDPVDVWFHDADEGEGTLIIRFSSDGPDYSSMPPSYWRRALANREHSRKDKIALIALTMLELNFIDKHERLHATFGEGESSDD